MPEKRECFVPSRKIRRKGKPLLPHGKGGYDYILKNFNKIVELVKKG